MLTKQDAKMAQGAAILGMLCLHLFCRVDYLPCEPKIWIGGVPLIYYFGLCSLSLCLLRKVLL